MAAKKKPAPALTQAQSTGQALSPDKSSASAAPVVGPAPETKSIDPGPLVDRLGELGEILAPYRAQFEEEKQLRSTVRGFADDKTTHIHGAKFIVVLAPRANETIVAYYDLAKRIGLDKYAQIATATLEKLCQAVNPGILAQYLRKTATGTRPLMVIRKDKAA